VTRSSPKDDHTCGDFGPRVMIAGMGQCVWYICAGVRPFLEQVHKQQLHPKSRSRSTQQSLFYQKYQALPSRQHGKVYSIHSRRSATGMRCHGCSCSCALHRVQGEQALHTRQAEGRSASLLGVGFEQHTCHTSSCAHRYLLTPFSHLHNGSHTHNIPSTAAAACCCRTVKA
jgi:hypothetical protein